MKVWISGPQNHIETYALNRGGVTCPKPIEIRPAGVWNHPQKPIGIRTAYIFGLSADSKSLRPFGLGLCDVNAGLAHQALKINRNLR